MLGGPLSRVTLVLLGIALLTACTAPTAAPPNAPLAATPTGNTDPQVRWNTTLEAARREGNVVVVTHTNQYFQQLIQKFREQYPEIQVEQVALRPSEFTPKVVTEQQNGVYGYDVWVSPTSNMVQTVGPAGGFEQLEPYLILPGVSDPQSYRGDQLLYATDDRNILLYQGNVDSNVYVNRDQLSSEQFQSFDQLLAPSLKGRIAIRTPTAPQAASLTLAGILHQRGKGFVQQLLTSQQPAFIDNARLLTQDLINGKYAVAMGIDNETLDACQREGGCKSIEQVEGDPYLLGYGVAVLKHPPHPNAAAVFVNWFMSHEGQQAYVQAVIDTTPPPYDQAHTIREDVTPSTDAVADKTIPDYAHLENYSLQGMEAGRSEMKTVLDLYDQIEAGQS
jgi:ABC-type Fe3+ transport system substrate-binding protein